MQPMKWQEYTKCSSHSLPNPTKGTNVVEEYERKYEGGEQQMLQDLDPMISFIYKIY
jgi:hypothetical protein